MRAPGGPDCASGLIADLRMTPCRIKSRHLFNQNGSSATCSSAARLDRRAFCPYAPTRGAQPRDQPCTTSAHVRRYSGLRRSNIVARIEQALRECGAEILARADPTTAPFEFTVKTPTGDQRELVCYAFTASRYRRAGGPPDRHRFQIGYGSGSDRCHQLYFDPRGKEDHVAVWRAPGDGPVRRR